MVGVGAAAAGVFVGGTAAAAGAGVLVGAAGATGAAGAVVGVAAGDEHAARALAAAARPRAPIKWRRLRMRSLFTTLSLFDLRLRVATILSVRPDRILCFAPWEVARGHERTPADKNWECRRQESESRIQNLEDDSCDCESR
jgi:hypothetical protein